MPPKPFLSFFRRPDDPDSPSSEQGSSGRYDQKKADKRQDNLLTRVNTLDSESGEASTNQPVSRPRATQNSPADPRDVLLHTLLEKQALRDTADRLGKDVEDPQVQELGRQTYQRNVQTLKGTLENFDDSYSKDEMRDQRAIVSEGISLITKNNVDALSSLPYTDSGDLVARIQNTMRLSVLQRPASELKISPSLRAPLEILMLGYDAIQTDRYGREFSEVEQVGKGGYGRVFKAKHNLDGRFYAVKRIPVSPAKLARMKNNGEGVMASMLEEVRSLASFDHNNIVRYHNAWWEVSTTIGTGPPTAAAGPSKPSPLWKQRLIEGSASSRVGSRQDTFSSDPTRSIIGTMNQDPGEDVSFGNTSSVSDGPDGREVSRAGFSSPSDSSLRAPNDPDAGSFVVFGEDTVGDDELSQGIPSSLSNLHLSHPSHDSLYNDPTQDNGDDIVFGYSTDADEEQNAEGDKESNTQGDQKSSAQGGARSSASGHPYLDMRSIRRRDRRSSRASQATIMTISSTYSRKSAVEEGDDDEDDIEEIDRSHMPNSQNLTSGASEGMISHSDAPGLAVSHPAFGPVLTLNVQMNLCNTNLATFLSADTGIKDQPLRHCFHPCVSLELLNHILAGVDYLHAQNVVHRDLKPANIFLSLSTARRPPYGSVDISTCTACPKRDRLHLIPRIGDFGLVAALGDECMISKPVGTHFYRPEKAGKINEKLDVFALGIITFEMLRKIDSQMERNELLKALREKHQFPADFASKLGSVGADCQQLIGSMLHLDEQKRASCDEVKAEVGRIVLGMKA